MQDNYKVFASVYDMMQYDVPYEFWTQKIKEYIHQNVNGARSVLELACGTGTIAIGLSKMGFYVEGCDLSEDMLAMAQEKAFSAGKNIKFIKQDMRTLDMRRTYDAVVCLCDGLNYITDLPSLKKVFQNVEKHLNPGGLFIFDLSTEYKLKEIIGNQTFAETFEEGAYIWENQYDEDTGILEFWLTLFVESEGSYQRSEEYHKQKSYSEEVVKSNIPTTFEFIGVYDGDTFENLSPSSQRMCVIVKKS